jgi:hypothetical protein
MGFLNLLMLLGLAGVAIPPIIHLLSRRRYEVVDWGAMQFLQISETTRRRLFIEELLLMLLRMGLIAILVLALAAPYVESTVLARLGGRANRDIVLLFDGSYSMGQTGTGKSAHDSAKEWAAGFLDSLAAGDSVAVLQAKQQVVPILAEPTHDLRRVREQLAKMASPRGGCDWPLALTSAFKILAKSKRPEREIIILSDNQRFGWADDNSLLRWELLAAQLREQSDIQPRVWVVNLAPERPDNPPNWTLAPLRASRAIASVGQQVTFRTALDIRGQEEYRPPHRLHLEVDGKPVTDLTPPPAAKLEKGLVPLSFSHRFVTPGSHLVSLIVEPDPPPEQRAPDYKIKDHLPGDNRQDFALEVLPALPVLLVDGDARPAPKRRGTDFLRDALAPARDPNPAVLARVVPIQEFDAALLTSDLGKEPGTKPRVLILSDVPRLTPQQQEGIVGFLAAGGGVLVTLGDRVEAQHYNDQLFRGGQGWLPARLDDLVGNETDVAHAPSPLASSFFHPALELFRNVKVGGLADARCPRCWKVTTPGRTSPAVPVALLSSNDPLLVERPYKNGRVMLCTVPLDNSWRTNLPDLPAFAPLAHELVFYLAGARSAENNLQPGQPLRFHSAGEEAFAGLMLLPPEGDAKPVAVGGDGTDPNVFAAQLVRQPQGPMLVFEKTRDIGVYQLRTADDRINYYVVQADPRESDLAACNEADRAKVAKFVPGLTYEDKRDTLQETLTASSQRQEMWWWFLFGVVGLLCGEVWMTRRLVRGR